MRKSLYRALLPVSDIANNHEHASKKGLNYHAIITVRHSI